MVKTDVLEAASGSVELNDLRNKAVVKITGRCCLFKLLVELSSHQGKRNWHLALHRGCYILASLR